MKKIYIAGKIGTWNINEVSNECKEKFANTEKWLREKYKGKCSIINPLKLIADRAEFLGEDNLDKIGIFTECVSGVMHSDAIYLLKDWQESEGATIEKQIAEYLGKEIIFEEKKMKNSTTNTPAESENNIKTSQNKDTISLVIYTVEKVYRKRYITIDKSFIDIHNKDYAENTYNLTTHCLKNQLINEDEEVIDYEII